MNTDKLQLLIDNKLSIEDRSNMMQEVKKDPVLKQELALLMKVRDIGRKRMGTLIPSKKGIAVTAKFSLAEIRRAAFGQNKEELTPLTALPIKDQTMDDFLNDDNDDLD